MGNKKSKKSIKRTIKNNRCVKDDYLILIEIYAIKSLKLPFYLTGLTMERCQRADLGNQPTNRRGTGMFKQMKFKKFI